MNETTYDKFKRDHPELLAAAEAQLEVTEEMARLHDELARYKTARCVMCGCPVASYHPAEAKRAAAKDKKIDRLFRENVLRREAIENHARAMEEEGIRSYYFDRELHAVVGIEERPKRWR